MKNKTVFLTGAGGAAIPGLIKHLKKNGYRVIAGDMDKLAVGLYLADKGFILPKGQSPEYLPTIRKICETEDVAAIVPLVDEELLTAIHLEEKNIPVILPRKDFIDTCLDKYKLMKKLAEHGIQVPKTKLASDGVDGLAFPTIAKPRVGRGSRGVQVLSSKEDFDRYMEVVKSPDTILIQEFIKGKEFTVSSIVWRDGNVLGVVPKEIIQKRGITRSAVTRKNASIDHICKTVQKCLKADGPFNVQLILDDKGEPFIFEINPRFSTSISLTMASGIDELTTILELAITGKKLASLEWEEGIVLLRQTLDEFITEEEYLDRQRNIFGGSND